MVEDPSNADGLPPTPSAKASPKISLKIVEKLETTRTPKGKGGLPAGSVEDWKVDDFLRDAMHFFVEFGLPRKGEKAFKIIDISDDAML